MTDEIRPETQTIGPDNPQEQAAEPAVLHIAERILHSTDAKAVSELLDVASIFYTAVATVLGSLVGACTYLLFRPFNPNALIPWLVFLLFAVGVGGLVGAVVIASIFNARGYIRWQRKYRPDERA